MGTVRTLVSLLAGTLALVYALTVADTASQQAFRLGAIGADSPLQMVYEPAWDTPPPDDGSDNLIFFRLATLLQLWPNTRYPSGGLICSIPSTLPTIYL